jgi:hypothetical protein
MGRSPANRTAASSGGSQDDHGGLCRRQATSQLGPARTPVVQRWSDALTYLLEGKRTVWTAFCLIWLLRNLRPFDEVDPTHSVT